MNHIATAEPSAPGVNYSLLIMEAAMAVKMAVETAVEMAPGAIPRPGRVPEQRVLSPESDFRDGCGSGWFSLFSSNWSMFLGQGRIYRRRVGVGGATGCPDDRGARPPLGPRRPVGWGPPGTPLTFLRCSGSFPKL